MIDDSENLLSTALQQPVPPASSDIAGPPSALDRFYDKATRVLAIGFAVGMIVLLTAIIYMIGKAAVPAVREHGFALITSATYDINRDEYGLRDAILGSLYSSLLALAIATVFGLAIAVFLSQGFLPRKIEIVFKNIVELLAAIPSVVYGLWGIFVIIPLLRSTTLHFTPLFHSYVNGPGMLPAALVLAIMVLPTISAISYDALSAVHPKLKEGAYGLGATRWETIFKVTLPTASAGIFGSVVLGYGRALGETMALAMLLGNQNQFSLSLFAPGNTLAALIANNFPEADTNEVNALLFAGLMLLTITLVVNLIGAAIIQYTNRGRRGAVAH